MTVLIVKSYDSKWILKNDANTLLKILWINSNLFGIAAMLPTTCNPKYYGIQLYLFIHYTEVPSSL